VSTTTRDILEELGGFVMKKRGEVDMKVCQHNINRNYPDGPVSRAMRYIYQYNNNADDYVSLPQVSRVIEHCVAAQLFRNV
jgi:hypothetical protein